MTRRFFLWLGKAALAGLLAFALLCFFCLLYYNVPVHDVNPTGATEYKWEPGRFYSRGTEGFAMGRTNSDGFNNLFDCAPGDPIDILLMGSSHMEGFNVAQEDNAAAQLNRLFAGEKTVYNIGTAGHTLLYCVKHLDAALDTYAPGQYVLLETMTLDFSPRDMDAVVSGTLADIPSRSGGVVRLLQKLPFLRLVYNNYFRGAESFGDIAQPAPAATPAPGEYDRALEALVDKLARESAAHGVKAVIVFNPGVGIAPDGSLSTRTKPEQLALFQQLCAEKGVAFLDLTEVYFDCYNEQHLLPSGFSNTAPARGHLNRVGHRLMAEALYAAIREWEG